MSDLKNEKLLTAKETARGVVTEALPSTLFRVKIDDKQEDENGDKREDKKSEKKESK
mgnify:CR=1 FL=1